MVSAVVLETTGVVSADFKQSEVGPIPLDWRVAPLREFLQCAPRYGVNAPAIPFDPSYPAYIRITDITEDGRFDPEARTSVKHSLASQYQLRCGDIVLARTGASTGKSYLYRPADGELVYAGFLIRICPDQSRLSSRFVRFWLQTPNYWSWVRANSMRSGQPGINAQQYASLPLPIPPTLAEQEAIADALEDADALIESLEQLIAKKRAVKQGAMQDLLSGRRRLPGFSRKWHQKPLGDGGTFFKGSGVRRDQAQSGDLPCIRYGELYTHHNDLIRRFNSWISKEVAATARKVLRGDILFAGSGETKDEIGKCAVLDAADEAYAGGDVIVFRPREDDPIFLGYYLNSASVQSQKAAKGQGDAVVHISSRALADLELVVPERDEQTAIAQVLLEMDAELDVLELRLQKARQIKQGMMQELLTGRVRLV